MPGVLRTLWRGLRGSSKATDDAARAVENADDATGAARNLGETTARDVAEGVPTVIRETGESAGNRVGLGLLGGGTALGGGLWLREREQTEQAEQSTERQQEYYDRLAEIEAMHSRGEISAAQMEQMKQEAREAYLAAQNPDQPRSVFGFLSSLGTIETVVLLAVLGAVLAKFLPVATRNFEIPNIRRSVLT